MLDSNTLEMLSEIVKDEFVVDKQKCKTLNSATVLI